MKTLKQFLLSDKVEHIIMVFTFGFMTIVMLIIIGLLIFETFTLT